METINDVLRQKGSEIYSISPDAAVFEAVKLVAEKNIGALLVLDKSEQVVGIFTERDYARKIALLGKDPKATPVRDVMTSKVMFIEGDKSIDDCMALMTKHRFRHLPVLKVGKLVGLVSIGDIVKAVISGKNLLIDQLGEYIVGNS